MTKVNYRRVSVLILAIVMIFALVACAPNAGGNDSDTDTDSKPQINFPTKDIRVIVPYAAGGNTDLDARKIASIIQIEGMLDEVMVVTNITGANTMNALQALLEADDDGHTLLMHHTALLASNASGAAEIMYNEMKPLIASSLQPFVLTIPADSEFKSVDDIVKFAKEKPNTMTIGYVGTGSTSHLAATLFLQAVGIYDEVKMVSYANAADALPAQLSGEIIMRIGPSADNARYVTSGDIVPLAVSWRSDSHIWEDVPTFKDLGGNVEYPCRQSYYVGIDTPDEVCEILANAIEQAQKTESYAEFCKTNGMTPSSDRGGSLELLLNQDYETVKALFDSGVMKK